MGMLTSYLLMDGDLHPADVCLTLSQPGARCRLMRQHGIVRQFQVRSVGMARY
jgi:hypothetical protein